MISSKETKMGAYKSICAEKYMPESEWINHELMKNPAYVAAKEAVEMGSTQKMGYVRRCEESQKKKLERNDEWFIVDHSSIL